MPLHPTRPSTGFAVSARALCAAAAASAFVFSAASPALFGADAPVWLIRQNFEKPTELTGNYPPNPGERFVLFENVFAGWSKDGGQVSLLYGQGIGHKASGGIHLETIKAAQPTGYYSLNAQPFVFPTVSSELVGGWVKKLFLEFHAKIPSGANVELQLRLQGSNDFKDRYYAARLVLGTVTGTGSYQAYTLRGADVTSDSQDAFVRLAKDMIANGAKLEFALSWHLHASAWTVAEGFSLDDVNFGFSN